MQFPYYPKHLSLKHGGRITRIDSCECVRSLPKDGRSQDTWHFVGAIECENGKSIDPYEIAPWSICWDHDDREAHAEGLAVNNAMADFLEANGTWSRNRKDGPIGWTASARTCTKRKALGT